MFMLAGSSHHKIYPFFTDQHSSLHFQCTSICLFCLFQSLSPDVVQSLESDPDYFKAVLQYHVVPGTTAASRVYNDLMLDTIMGSKLRVNEYSTVGSHVILLAYRVAILNIICKIHTVSSKISGTNDKCFNSF